MNADCESYRRRGSHPALDVPKLDFFAQREGASDRALCCVILAPERAECRHQAVAKILVEGAFVIQHDPGTAPLKILKQCEGVLRQKALGQSREPDDVGKKDCDMTCRRIAEGPGRLVGQGARDVGRDVAGKVRTNHLRLDFGEEVDATAQNGKGQQTRKEGCHQIWMIQAAGLT